MKPKSEVDRSAGIPAGSVSVFGMKLAFPVSAQVAEQPSQRGL